MNRETIHRATIREVTVEVASGLELLVHEHADVDEVLAAAAGGAAVDPYAAILWPTALAVARELVGRVGAGVRVVDAGAGTGLCALTAARLGATSLALDHDVGALERIRGAAAAQGLEVATARFELFGPDPLPAADVVVFADVLYEVALARAVAGRVAEAVNRGARVVVGDPGRVGRPEFERELSRLGVNASFRDVEVRLPGERRASVVGVAWIPGEPQHV